MSLNENWKLLRQARGSPSRKKTPSANKNKCTACGASSNGFIVDEKEGDIICGNCGVVQKNRVMFNQSPQQGNANNKVRLPRNIIEENAYIRRLVVSFFNIIFSGLTNNSAFGRAIAGTYQDFKVYRARYITKSYKKGEHITSMKGLHMPTVIACILYCTLAQQRRAIPLSLICSIMNIVLKNNKEHAPIVINHAFKYKTEKKYGLSRFFQLRNFGCQNASVPSDYTDFTSRSIFSIQDKNIVRQIGRLANEIFKEYPEMTSPSKIANYVLYFIGSKNNAYDHNYFGITKKEGSDFVRKLYESTNPAVQEILQIFN